MSLTDSDSDLLQRIAAQVQTPQKPPVESVVDKIGEVEEAVAPEPEKLWNFSGIGPKSRILTSFGHVPMEALRRRDPVRTFEGRYLEVEHVDEIRLDRRFLIMHPEAQPIMIPRHSLGAGAPSVDMFVSGSQKMRMTDRANRVRGVKAEEMIGRAGIMRKSHGYFTYYTFHCGEPCTVQIDGVWCHVGPNKAPMDA